MGCVSQERIKMQECNVNGRRNLVALSAASQRRGEFCCTSRSCNTLWKTYEHELLLALHALIVVIMQSPRNYSEAEYHPLLLFPITCFLSVCSQVASLSTTRLAAREPKYLEMCSLFLSPEQDCKILFQSLLGESHCFDRSTSSLSYSLLTPFTSWFP